MSLSVASVLYFSLFLILSHISGLRLADKRSLPCPNRVKWLEARDSLYEEIMTKAWNKEGKFFGQSYEDTSVLDSAVLIMPLVFFMQAVSYINSKATEVKRDNNPSSPILVLSVL